MARYLAVVMAVVLVSAAGCSTAGLASHRSAETTTPTVSSPSATPTDRAASTATPVFPDGASDAGIDNGTRLVERHEALLANRSYSERLDWDEMTRRQGNNGTFLGFDVDSYTQTVANGTNATRISMLGANETEVHWLTESITASRIHRSDPANDFSRTRYTYATAGPTPREVDRVRRAPIGLVSDLVLLKYLIGVDYEHEGTVTRDNRRLHAFTATGLNDSVRPPLSFSTESLERVDVTLLIDQRGIIHTLNASEVHAVGNESVTVGVNYTVRNVETAAPTRPDWVTTELPHLRATVTANGTVVALSHTGGRAIQLAANLFLETPTRSTHTLFLGSFEPGDTLYLYLRQNETDRISGSRNERPTETDSFEALGGDTVSLSVDRTVTESDDAGATIRIEVHNETASGNESRASNASAAGAWRSTAGGPDC